MTAFRKFMRETAGWITLLAILAGSTAGALLVLRFVKMNRPYVQSWVLRAHDKLLGVPVASSVVLPCATEAATPLNAEEILIACKDGGMISWRLDNGQLVTLVRDGRRFITDPGTKCLPEIHVIARCGSGAFVFGAGGARSVWYLPDLNQPTTWQWKKTNENAMAAGCLGNDNIAWSDGNFLYWGTLGSSFQRIELPGFIRDIVVGGENWVAVATGDDVCAVDTLSGHRKWCQEAHGGRHSWRVAADGLGHVVASGGADTWVRFWTADTGSLISSVGPLEWGAESLQFSPNGACVLAMGWMGRLQIWQYPTLAPVQTISGFGEHSRIYFMPDGKSLVVLGGLAGWAARHLRFNERTCSLM